MSEGKVDLLRAAGLAPVLVDVGSAGISHQIWQPIASQSVVVGFDPDSRNQDKAFGKGYARAVMVDKAVSPDDTAESVDFILTEYPSCSSMLEPDLEQLSSFSFRDFFRPVRRCTVPATSLNRIIEAEQLGTIHWIKLDSQGADLRLLQSLGLPHWKKLLAVDIEPGLIKAYKGEDLFTDCHSWLIDQGFWMSRLEYQSYPKLRPETLDELSEHTGIDREQLMRRLPRAPTAVEGRYLREVAWLRDSAEGPAALVLASVFGLLDGQFGYAYDVASAYTERFGNDELAGAMRKLAVEGMG